MARKSEDALWQVVFTAAPAQRREFEPRFRAFEREDPAPSAARYGLSRTTVTKWRARTSTADAGMKKKKNKSIVLTLIEEAMIVEFRRRRGRCDGLP